MTTDTPSPSGFSERRLRSRSARKHTSRRIIPLVVVTFFVFVASAQAHNEAATTACSAANGNTVTFNWTNFAFSGTGNGGFNTPTWQIVYTPTVGSPSTLTGSVSFPSSTYSYTVTIPSGAGSVVASSSWTSSQTTDGNASSYTNDLTVGNCFATPAISTTASPGVAAGGSISDEAVLSGGRSPTGTITFELYAASDTTCSTPLSTGTAAVNGDGTYSSPVVTNSTAGTYQWVASYSGDANNVPVTDGCNQPAEQVTVTPPTPTPPTPPTPTPPTPTPPTPTPPAHPSIVTTASPSTGCAFTATTPTCKIADTAVLSGGSSPTGTITFRLYTSRDTTCSTPLTTSTVPVNGNGTYPSPVVTQRNPVAYQWTASYSGDANNAAVAEGCGQRPEQVPILIPGAACVASPVALRGVFGTRAGTFTVRLTALGVKRVTFYLDGHKLKTVTKAHGNYFTIAINTTGLSFGMHHLVAKATMKNKNCKTVERKGSFVHGIPPFS